MWKYSLKNKELALIQEKMVLDGYVVRLGLADVKEMVALLCNAANSLNQIARRVNESGSLYAEDVEDLRRNYDRIGDRAGKLLAVLAGIR